MKTKETIHCLRLMQLFVSAAPGVRLLFLASLSALLFCFADADAADAADADAAAAVAATRSISVQVANWLKCLQRILPKNPKESHKIPEKSQKIPQKSQRNHGKTIEIQPKNYHNIHTT